MPGRRFLAGALLACMVFGVARAAGLNHSLARLSELQAQMRRTQEELQKLRGSRFRVLGTIREKQLQVQYTRERLAGLTAQEIATREALGQEKKRLALLRNTIHQEDEASGILLRNIQEEGPDGYLAVLLGARSYADFLSRFDTLGDFLRVDMRLFARLSADRSSLSATVATLDAEDRRLAATEESLRTTRAELTAQLGQARESLAALDRDLRSREEALQEMREASERLISIIQSLESPGTGAAIGSIHFIWPVHGPVTSPFGMRLDPILHKWYLHTGIDIGVPEGTPVHAAAAGTVLVAGYINGYGNTVILDNGGGVSTLYAHAEKLLVSVGEKVAQGQVIDLAGMTGWATGPHVHFEIRINGHPVNPRPYLPG